MPLTNTDIATAVRRGFSEHGLTPVRGEWISEDDCGGQAGCGLVSALVALGHAVSAAGDDDPVDTAAEIAEIIGRPQAWVDGFTDGWDGLRVDWIDTMIYDEQQLKDYTDGNALGASLWREVSSTYGVVETPVGAAPVGELAMAGA